MFSAKTYAARRNMLRTKIGSGIVLFPGNPLSPNNYPNNAYYFRQDSSFRYYFGLNTPSLAGLIDADTGEEALYGDDFTVEDIIWTGPQPTLRELGAKVGIAATHPLSELEKRLRKAISLGRKIHFLPPYRGETKLWLSSLLGIKPTLLHDYKSVDLMFAVAEMREKKSAEELRKIEKLRREVEYEQDAYNRQKLQQQLDEAVASREERLRKLELKQQKEALQEEIEKIRDQASEKIKELDGEQDAIEKAYEERLKAASLQAEAEKLLMTKSQDEIMNLLYEYVPEYDALGKSMGEKLLEGFQSKVGSITDWFRSFNDQLARMQEELAGSLNAATDRFYESRRDTASQSGAGGATMVQQTVNFYEPVESPSQVARRMEDVNDQLGMMMA